MRLKAALVCCLLAGLVVAVAGIAQEGHPLTGVWYGDWGPNATQRNHLTIQMNWDGKNVTGIVNPGPDSKGFRTGSECGAVEFPKAVEALGSPRS